MSTRIWKRLATTPGIEDVLLDTDGVTQLNLSGATVTLIMGKVGSTATLIATATHPGGGTVQYSWGTADLATVGLYYQYWKITYAGGAIEKMPSGGRWPGAPDYNLIRVVSDLT